MPRSALAPPAAPPAALPAAVTGLREQARPVALADTQVLAVPAPLAELVPGAGLCRGSTVAVSGGAGATSLALALAAGASASEAWVAALGLPDLGVAAAGEAGIALDRLVLVTAPPAAWASAAATLLDAFDVVLARPPAHLRAADARRLITRLRDGGAVLVLIGITGLGAQPADLTLTVAATTWHGTDGGHGHLAARRIEVVTGGRGSASRPRRATLWLPGPESAVAESEPVPGDRGEPVLREVG